MKKVTVFLSLIFLAATSMAEANNKVLKCENKIYRDATLVMEQGSVLIRDMPQGGSVLSRVLEKKLNLSEDSVVLQNVQIQAINGVECNSNLTMLNTCRLVEEDARAFLQADVLIISNGVVGAAKLNLRVVLKKFHARTNLQSTGGVFLGNGSNQVTLDTVNAVAQVKMLIDETEVDLNFETPYWIPAKNSKDSFCQVK